MTIAMPLQAGDYKALVERVDSAKNAEEAVRAFKQLKAVMASGGDARTQPIVPAAAKSLGGYSCRR